MHPGASYLLTKRADIRYLPSLAQEHQDSWTCTWKYPFGDFIFPFPINSSHSSHSQEPDAGQYLMNNKSNFQSRFVISDNQPLFCTGKRFQPQSQKLLQHGRTSTGPVGIHTQSSDNKRYHCYFSSQPLSEKEPAGLAISWWAAGMQVQFNEVDMTFSLCKIVFCHLTGLRKPFPEITVLLCTTPLPYQENIFLNL